MMQDKNTLPALLLKNIKFSWPHAQQTLLSINELRVARNEHVFLYGPSGSGKTSLLNIIAGICLPQQGRVDVLGEDLTALSQRQRDRFRARHIGIIFQQFNLIPYLSVLDNLMLRAEFSISPKKESNKNVLRQKAVALLDALGLSASLRQRAQFLSVDQQQRVAVARALINSPEIIIADEPTSALDSDSRDTFIELLFASAQEANSTIIFVSHDKTLSHFFNRSIDIKAVQMNSPQEAAPCR